MNSKAAVNADKASTAAFAVWQHPKGVLHLLTSSKHKKRLSSWTTSSCGKHLSIWLLIREHKVEHMLPGLHLEYLTLRLMAEDAVAYI